jgi:hypothetical protein
MNEQPGEAMLETLRAEGLQRHNPARFHYLEVLALRLPSQPATVQQVLAQRLEQAVATYAREARCAAAAAAAPGAGTHPATGAQSPLAQLNHELRARASAEPHAAATDPLHASAGVHLPDMKSVRQFSEVWSKISAEQQVVQALHRGPENAGPLNSHKLVLRTLSLMRSLSPDYLRRFMSQMDALLWLDQAGTRAPAQAARAPRKGRGKG